MSGRPCWRGARCREVLTLAHAFSGPSRPGDLEWWLLRLGRAAGWPVIEWSLDLCRPEPANLLSNALFGCLRKACWSGDIFGYHGGRGACNTWSAALWRRPGPGPLRDRARPFGRSGLSVAQREKCDRGSELSLGNLSLITGVITSGGCATAEHPADRGYAPFASWWNTPQWKEAIQTLPGVHTISFGQCMMGTSSRKPTTTPGGCVDDLEHFASYRCTHPPASTRR